MCAKSFSSLSLMSLSPQLQELARQRRHDRGQSESAGRGWGRRPLHDHQPGSSAAPGLRAPRSVSPSRLRVISTSGVPLVHRHALVRRGNFGLTRVFLSSVGTGRRPAGSSFYGRAMAIAGGRCSIAVRCSPTPAATTASSAGRSTPLASFPKALTTGGRRSTPGVSRGIPPLPGPTWRDPRCAWTASSIPPSSHGHCYDRGL